LIKKKCRPVTAEIIVIKSLIFNSSTRKFDRIREIITTISRDNQSYTHLLENYFVSKPGPF